MALYWLGWPWYTLPGTPTLVHLAHHHVHHPTRPGYPPPASWPHGPGTLAGMVRGAQVVHQALFVEMEILSPLGQTCTVTHRHKWPALDVLTTSTRAQNTRRLITRNTKGIFLI